MGWEVDHYDITGCPCGKGKVVEARHSPDNPWSRPYSEVEINCDDCSKIWDANFSGSELVHKAFQHASRQADRVADKASAAVLSYLNGLLPALQFPSFKTMAEEFAYLVKAGLFVGKVGEYRYARRSAKMSELAQVRNGLAVIPTLLNAGGAKDYQTLLGMEKAAHEDAIKKRAAITRFKVPKI